MTTQEAIKIILDFMNWSFMENSELTHKISDVESAMEILPNIVNLAYNQAVEDIAEKWDCFPFPVQKEDILKMRKA